MGRKKRRSLREALEDQNKEALIALIERLVAVDAGLEEIVRISITPPPSKERFDPGPARERADEVFATHEPGWRDSDRILEALGRLETTAGALEESGRPCGAASDYAGLMLSVADHIEWQDECEYEWILESCGEGLERCMDAEERVDEVERMLDIFGEILAFDLMAGGYGLDEFAGSVFVKRASRDHRLRFVQRLCEDFGALQRSEMSDLFYQRGALSRWMTRLLPNVDPAEQIPSLSEALPGLKENVEACIAKRNRASYHEACQWLKRVEAGYKAAGDADGFIVYVAELRARYSKLRSLHAELRRVGF